MQKTCEIRSGHNGVFDCTRQAVGSWLFDIEYKSRSQAVMVCRWHANHFARKGFWDVTRAFKPLEEVSIEEVR